MSGSDVSPDTLLVVRSWNSLSGLVLAVVGRFLDAKGQLRTFEFGHTPNTDRSQAESTYALTAAQLIDFAVVPKTGTPRRGQCYVTVGLAVRTRPTTEYYQVLAKGYVTAEGGLLWPGGLYLDSVEGPGLLRSVLGTNPAAGAEITEAVPTNARWRLRGLSALLTTDVTVPVRTAIFVLDDGAIPLLRFPSATTQAASVNRTYNLAEYSYQPAAVLDQIFLPVPSRLYLFQGWRILTSTANLVAGDNWAAPQMMVEEWIEE